MPPKKDTKKSDSKKKEEKSNTSKKDPEKKSSKKDTVKKTSKKEPEKKSSKKDTVKKTNKKDTVKKTNKKEPEKKSNKKENKKTKVVSSSKKKVDFNPSEDSNSDSEDDNSLFTKSDSSDNQNEYENTETKMSEFFSDDIDTINDNNDSEFTEIKSETIDSIDPKETIYNSFVTKQNKPKDQLFQNNTNIVEKSDRLTNPRMTKYEMVRVIGERTKQFKMGAKPLIKNTDDLTYEEKAVLELKKNMTPFKIKRPLPNNTVEIWEISELNKDHLEF